jgi:hypothetical protein
VGSASRTPSGGIPRGLFSSVPGLGSSFTPLGSAKRTPGSEFQGLRELPSLCRVLEHGFDSIHSGSFISSVLASCVTLLVASPPIWPVTSCAALEQVVCVDFYLRSRRRCPNRVGTKRPWDKCASGRRSEGTATRGHLMSFHFAAWAPCGGPREFEYDFLFSSTLVPFLRSTGTSAAHVCISRGFSHLSFLRNATFHGARRFELGTRFLGHPTPVRTLRVLSRPCRVSGRGFLVPHLHRSIL